MKQKLYPWLGLNVTYLIIGIKVKCAPTSAKLSRGKYQFVANELNSRQTSRITRKVNEQFARPVVREYPRFSRPWSSSVAIPSARSASTWRNFVRRSRISKRGRARARRPIRSFGDARHYFRRRTAIRRGGGAVGRGSPMVERGCCARWFVSCTRANTHDDNTAVPVDDDDASARACVLCARSSYSPSLSRRFREWQPSVLRSTRRDAPYRQWPVLLCAPIGTREQPVAPNGWSRLIGKQISG